MPAVTSHQLRHHVDQCVPPLPRRYNHCAPTAADFRFIVLCDVCPRLQRTWTTMPQLACFANGTYRETLVLPVFVSVLPTESIVVLRCVVMSVFERFFLCWRRIFCSFLLVRFFLLFLIRFDLSLRWHVYDAIHPPSLLSPDRPEGDFQFSARLQFNFHVPS